MTALIDQARGVLEGSASVSQLEAVIQSIRERFTESRDRHQLVKQGGQARQVATEAGDFEALKALEGETRDLGLEMELLQSLQNSLGKALTAARAREAVENLPDAYANLVGLMETEAAALNALQQARTATEARLNEIEQARLNVFRCGHDGGPKLQAPEADPALLARYCSLRGIKPSPNVGWGQGGRVLQKVADQLGVEMRRTSDVA